MTITSYPEDYTGALTDFTYTVAGLDPDSVTEIEILDGNGEVLGIKRFRGAAVQQVSVASYFTKRFGITPPTDTRTGFSREAEATQNCAIRAGGIRSGNSILTAGRLSAPHLTYLSESPLRVFADPAECDRLYFRAPGETVSARVTVITKKRSERSVDIAATVCGAGIYYFTLNLAEYTRAGNTGLSVGSETGAASLSSGNDTAPLPTASATTAATIADTATSTTTATTAEDNTAADSKTTADTVVAVTLELTTAAGAFVTKEYRIGPSLPDPVRFYWLNGFGVIDNFTFGRIAEKSRRGRKSRIYTGSGYKVCGSYSDTCYTFASDYEPAATMEWLGGMLFSPCVWMGSEGRLLPVDVVTDIAPVISDGLSRLVFEVRENKRTDYRNI